MSKTSQYPAVHLDRIIPASPAEVYDAWLDPDTLLHWLAPGGSQIRNAEADRRVGGHYRIWHTAGGSSASGFECEITELVPNQRIVFRWGFVGPERTNGPVFDSLLTINREQAPHGMTHLTLVHESLEALASALPHVAEQVESGWESVVAKLAAMFNNQRESPDA